MRSLPGPAARSRTKAGASWPRSTRGSPEPSACHTRTVVAEGRGDDAPPCRWSTRPRRRSSRGPGAPGAGRSRRRSTPAACDRPTPSARCACRRGSTPPRRRRGRGPGSRGASPEPSTFHRRTVLFEGRGGDALAVGADRRSAQSPVSWPRSTRGLEPDPSASHPRAVLSREAERALAVRGPRHGEGEVLVAAEHDGLPGAVGVPHPHRLVGGGGGDALPPAPPPPRRNAILVPPSTRGRPEPSLLHTRAVLSSARRRGRGGLSGLKDAV